MSMLLTLRRSMESGGVAEEASAPSTRPSSGIQSMGASLKCSQQMEAPRAAGAAQPTHLLPLGGLCLGVTLWEVYYHTVDSNKLHGRPRLLMVRVIWSQIHCH